jgi:hypothetical protein
MNQITISDSESEKDFSDSEEYYDISSSSEESESEFSESEYSDHELEKPTQNNKTVEKLKKIVGSSLYFNFFK